MQLFEASWRRCGLRRRATTSCSSAQRAVGALRRYWELDRDARRRSRCGSSARFAFKLGPHLLRGRVDRVDRLPDGTLRADRLQDRARPRRHDELREDVQLSLYQMGAREAWGLETSAQSYYYVLDEREGAGRALRGGARPRARHGGRDRRGDHAPGVRAAALARASARSATTGSSAPPPRSERPGGWPRRSGRRSRRRSARGVAQAARRRRHRVRRRDAAPWTAGGARRRAALRPARPGDRRARRVMSARAACRERVRVRSRARRGSCSGGRCASTRVRAGSRTTRPPELRRPVTRSTRAGRPAGRARPRR